MEHFEDGYSIVVRDYDALINEIKRNEETTEWIPGVISKHITVSAFEPIETQELADETGIPNEILRDTAQNTKMWLEYGGKKYCLRDTTKNTILETAKINGSALNKMSPYMLSEVLNKCFTVAKGDSLLLKRGGKICALLSDNIYKVMPIKELLDNTIKTLKEKFGELSFVEGENNYEYTSAVWELPESQDKLLDAYDDVVALHPARLYGRTFMPAVRFITSDIGQSAATLLPLFKHKKGAYFRFNDGIKVPHKMNLRGKSTGVEAYKEAIQGIFAKFHDMEKTLGMMAKCEICNPLNVLVGLCKKAGISKKYASEAYDDIESFTNGGTRSCYMDDIYLAIAGCTSTAKHMGVKGYKLLEIEECVAKILCYVWAEFDVPGVVAWN